MHKMEVDLIIKFGGSAITDKNIFETIRRQELSIAAQCIKTCTDHGLKCIVVHGAGLVLISVQQVYILFRCSFKKK